ncbi:hypothetical protein BKA63DRAFT_595006 [Paraphoma chrysanthemicola]|nr:hypothetical protein BKA63DRAFT_595006 [Paraphoma chrysanthemicola]
MPTQAAQNPYPETAPVQEYYCPQHNGVTYSTGGKCFQLHCNTATTMRTPAIHSFPSTSLKVCADACAREPRCAACDVHGPGQRNNPNICVLFGTNGPMIAANFINYWAPTSMNECGSPESPRNRPISPPYTDDQGANCPDPQDGPTVIYKYCTVSSDPYGA